ncbi:unnamed protein product [Calicophoron daubneyi]|uniref:Alkyl transferase n=1 Tax=Calicophoron daubneyi TaxID=300641 RepID=A0AAV2T8K3_CALDB
MVWSNQDYQYSYLQRFCMHLIKYGPIPKHVAFIMDGNRRFAGAHQLKNSDGHMRGFSKLSEVLRWCKDIGIEELSVFAFSIENFNRNQEEVSFLLNLAADKLEELLEKEEELTSYGICIRIIGNLSMLPTRLQRLAGEIMLRTRENSKAVLNICLAYTGRDEITAAAEEIRLGVLNRQIFPSDIDPQLLSGCLYTRLSRPLDMIVRTSGEVRLSDFLAWQGAQNGAVYKFVEHYWPNFSFWDFMGAVLHYQLCLTRISKLLQPIPDYPNTPQDALHTRLSGFTANDNEDDARRKRVRQFLDRVDCDFWNRLEKMTLNTSSNNTTPELRSAQRSVGDSSVA